MQQEEKEQHQRAKINCMLKKKIKTYKNKCNRRYHFYYTETNVMDASNFTTNLHCFAG